MRPLKENRYRIKLRKFEIRRRNHLLCLNMRIPLLLTAIVGITALAGRSRAQQPTKPSYEKLKQYEGLYEYFGNDKLLIAASPKDTMLYAIINKSKYPLKAHDSDVFYSQSNDPVQFLRNDKGEISGYTTDKKTFKLITKKVNFPVQMWYPRVVADPQHYAYQYTRPKQINDGLETGGIKGSGLDLQLLSNMMHEIVADKYPNVHSILILKNNKLVFEEYFYDYTRDTLQEMRSASKSMVSAMVGIAIQQGLIKSVHERLVDLLPEYHFANPSPLKDKITLKDLLDNQSGVNYDEAWDKTKGNETDMDASNDWVKYTFDLPMIDTPGIRGRYNSGNPITAGWIVEKYAKMPMRDYAAKNLFGPLGITDFKWNFKPDRSNINNYCQVLLTPRDMAKFGLLYLNNGVWKGKQVIPAAWVKESTTKQSVVENVDYGYLWWLKYFDAGNVRYYSFGAQGNGGQKIYVFRDQQLVVVTTGGNFNSQSPSDYLIKTYILPAFNPHQ